jgi:hypothetical protein
MYHQFTIQHLYALHKMYLCVWYLSENNQRLVQLQKQLISFYNIDLTHYNTVVTTCTKSLIFDKCTL